MSHLRAWVRMFQIQKRKLSSSEDTVLDRMVATPHKEVKTALHSQVPRLGVCSGTMHETQKIDEFTFMFYLTNVIGKENKGETSHGVPTICACEPR
jgi:hypothetical protein